MKSQNKYDKRRPKPWWCQELDEMWKTLCNLERDFVRYNGARRQKQRLRQQYKNAQNEFDRVYRRKKRKFQHDKLLHIKALETNDPAKFWEAIKRLGPKNKFGEIPSEVVLEDGSVSNDPDVVMDEWRNVFCKLFQNQDTGGLSGFDDELYEYIVQRKIQMENGDVESPNMFRYDLFGDTINDIVEMRLIYL